MPLRDVRLTAGPFADAQRRALRTVLALDPDRLLSPYRREAGLVAGEGYGGWERDGLGGHTLGHALSALAGHAATGSAEAAARADVLVAGLRECQAAGGTGYVGGVPGGEALWREIAGGRIDAHPFELNGRWVPLYNLHKTLAGLVDLVEHTGSAEAAEVAEPFVAWWIRTAGALSDDDLAEVLRTESGGLATALAHWAEVTGDAGAARLAARLSPRAVWEPLAAGRDDLDGRHANAHIPLAVGFAALGRIDPTATHLLTAAGTFFASVLDHRTTPLGGNSVREHFPPRDDWSTVFTAREGPETCNTVNMVELARELYRATGDRRSLEYIERALCNHLLSMQHPDHGGVVYFTPHRPGHYRVYARADEGFWCCMGTGLEAPARFAALAYAHADDRLDVNLLMGSEVRWQGVTVQTRSDFPFEDAAVLTVGTPSARRFVLRIRVPAGVAGQGEARLDGEVHRAPAGGWIEIDRVWHGATRVEVDLPPALRWESAPDDSGWGSLVDGPRVLAHRLTGYDDDALATGARMGHIARGPLLPLSAAPVLDPHALERAERRADGMVAVPRSDGEGTSVVLEPFAALHDDRYILSWPLAAPTAAGARRAELAARDAAADALETRSLDAVAFGQQQPESDHSLAVGDSINGYDDGRHWRRFRHEGAVTLQDWGAAAATLRISWLADDAPRRILIHLDDDLVLDGQVPGGAGAATERDVDLRAWADGRTHWRVRITGGSAGTPRLTEVRLLSAPAGPSASVLDPP